MIFYNQNDYEHIAYPSEESPKSELKAAGCGVCSASMIVENMTAHKLPPEECAKLSLSCGGRDNSGTDMEKLAPEICRLYGLSFVSTSNIEDVMAHLKTGGMCIANPGGDYEGHIGVFTSGGHFIVLTGIDGTTVEILDPNLKDGGFDKEGRRGKVRVEGNVCYCDLSTLVLDCANRDPAYYLFSK